jgi:hypothetical protein
MLETNRTEGVRTVRHRPHRPRTPERREPPAVAFAPHDAPPGRYADVKTDPCSHGALRTPVGVEVECAHLLANEARHALTEWGLDDREILRYADDFVAEDRGGDVAAFIGWAIQMHLNRVRSRAPLG